MLTKPSRSNYYRHIGDGAPSLSPLQLLTLQVAYWPGGCLPH